MSIEVRVPDLGDSIESGEVLEIMVAEGDHIEKEQGILELETDKATVEVPSSHTGRITKVHVKVGQSIGSGAVLLTIEAAETSPAASPPAQATPASEPAAPAPAPPRAAVPAPKASSPQPATPQPATPTPVAQPAADATPAGSVAAGPAVRRFAREVGVDLSTVQGSGSAGRITRDDVLEAVRRPSPTPAPVAAVDGAAPQAGPGDAATDAWGPIRIDRMPKIRRTIAAQMHKSWETCPRVTNFDDVDVTDLEQLRQSSKADYAKLGIKLTSMPFVIKSIAMALRDHPIVNASVDMEAGQIIYKDYVNIGIAVDTERGLVVPVLRNVDQLSIPDIARQVSKIAEKARNNDFSIDELRGGTFTISNLGAVGGTYSTPIINVPELAILLVGRSRKLPWVMENDEIAARLIMPLSLSYDHRLVDGAAAARFLNEVIGYLKAPSRLLLAP